MRCVVFGATGYIGGGLVPELLRAGHHVRVAARTPAKLAEVPWRERVEAVRADLTIDEHVRAAVAGQEVLYYLVHSLTCHDFATIDRRAARCRRGRAGGRSRAHRLPGRNHPRATAAVAAPGLPRRGR